MKNASIAAAKLLGKVYLTNPHFFACGLLHKADLRPSCFFIMSHTCEKATQTMKFPEYHWANLPM